MTFDLFWQTYPRRVAKFAAKRAYDKALKLATHEEIMAGVERYKRNKPEYADWCHPATFLNQGRWMDEDDAPEGPDLTKYRPCTEEEAREYTREHYPNLADSPTYEPAKYVPRDWRPKLRAVK